MIKLNETKLREIVRTAVRHRLEVDRDREDNERETMKLTRKQLEHVVNEEYARARGLTEAVPPPGLPDDRMSMGQFVNTFMTQLESLSEEIAMELAGHLGNDSVTRLQVIFEYAFSEAVHKAISDFEKETGQSIWPE